MDYKAATENDRQIKPPANDPRRPRKKLIAEHYKSLAIFKAIKHKDPFNTSIQERINSLEYLLG